MLGKVSQQEMVKGGGGGGEGLGHIRDGRCGRRSVNGHFWKKQGQHTKHLHPDQLARRPGMVVWPCRERICFSYDDI